MVFVTTVHGLKIGLPSRALYTLASTNGKFGPAQRLVWPPSTFIGVPVTRSEEHTSELQSLMRISYAVFCLKKKNITSNQQKYNSSLNTYTTCIISLHKEL